MSVEQNVEKLDRSFCYMQQIDACISKTSTGRTNSTEEGNREKRNEIAAAAQKLVQTWIRIVNDAFSK